MLSSVGYNCFAFIDNRIRLVSGESEGNRFFAAPCFTNAEAFMLPYQTWAPCTGPLRLTFSVH